MLPFRGTMGTSGGNGVARATPCWCFWRPQVGLPDGARAPNPAELGARALAVVEFVCLASPPLPPFRAGSRPPLEFLGDHLDEVGASIRTIKFHCHACVYLPRQAEVVGTQVPPIDSARALAWAYSPAATLLVDNDGVSNRWWLWVRVGAGGCGFGWKGCGAESGRALARLCRFHKR